MYNNNWPYPPNRPQVSLSSFLNASQKSKRRVFISFSMNDLFYKKALEQQAKSDRFQLEFTNYSVNEPFDSKWRTQCKERLKTVSVVVCLVGEDTASRDAVNWELNTAYELGKKVFAIRIFRNQSHTIPLPIIMNRSKVLNWDIAAIVSELNS